MPIAEGFRLPLLRYRRADAPQLAASHCSPKLYCREERWHCGFLVVVRSQPHTTAAFPEILTHFFFKSNRARPFLDSSSRWSSEQIVRLFWYPKVCQRDHTSLPLDPVQIKFDPFTVSHTIQATLSHNLPLYFYVYLQACFPRVVRPVFYTYFWCVPFVLHSLSASLCIKSITVVRATYHVAGQDLGTIDNSDEARRGTAWRLQCRALRTRPGSFVSFLSLWL